MIIYSKTHQTYDQHSAKNMGSGRLDVLATPALIAFVENACFSYLQDQLTDPDTSVGSAISLEHLAASKIGQEVTVSITGLQEAGRHVDFDLQAYVGNRLIGRAKHSRVVVDADRFLARLQ